MSFVAYLQDFQELFEPTVLKFFVQQSQRAEKLNFSSAENLEQIKILVASGGKRLRPALVYFGSLLGKNPDLETKNLDSRTENVSLEREKTRENVLQAGLALEMLHTFALIHDDIIDQSLLRRGKPTIEANYQQIFQQRGFDEAKSRHLAASAAILAGDLAHTLADELMATLALTSSQQKNDLQKIYLEMQFELIGGQLDDCFGVGLSSLKDLQPEKIFSMLKHKSGNYSIQKPLLLGAILGQIDRQKTQVLEQIGENLGLVFQITDDILGLFGEEQITGKSVVSDILEGKKTLLMLETYLASSEEEKQFLEQTLGNPEATKNQIERLKNLVQETGALKKMQEFCREKVHQSQELLRENFEPKNPGFQFIFGLSNYLLERKK